MSWSMCPYESTVFPTMRYDSAETHRVQASRRHGGTGIGLPPSQAASHNAAGQIWKRKMGYRWCARRLICLYARLSILRARHVLASQIHGPPQHGSKNAPNGCLLLLAQLSSGELGAVPAIA